MGMAMVREHIRTKCMALEWWNSNMYQICGTRALTLRNKLRYKSLHQQCKIDLDNNNSNIVPPFHRLWTFLNNRRSRKTKPQQPLHQIPTL
jgi:hypothetical protein